MNKLEKITLSSMIVIISFVIFCECYPFFNNGRKILYEFYKKT